MIQVVTAPSDDQTQYISVFLAGGITNCKEWQKEVLAELELEDVTIYNPRRDSFDISDKTASDRQITWEYEKLERMDIFSMYFCSGPSDQPICMYELGRNIVRMQNRFPSDWEKRIVISVESGYSRAFDVVKQVNLCAPKLFIYPDATPEAHARQIRRTVRSLNR